MRVTRSGLFGCHQARFTVDRCDGLAKEAADKEATEKADAKETF